MSEKCRNNNNKYEYSFYLCRYDERSRLLRHFSDILIMRNTSTFRQLVILAKLHAQTVFLQIIEFKKMYL